MSKKDTFKIVKNIGADTKIFQSTRPTLPVGGCGEVWGFGGDWGFCPGLSGRRSRGERAAVPLMIVLITQMRSRNSAKSMKFLSETSTLLFW